MRFSPALRDLNWLVARPIAHRGLQHNKATENTEAAFAAAIEKDYAIECDLQLTADNEAVVFHDDTVDHLLDGSGPVKSFTTKQIKNMTFKSGTSRVQTFAELLEQIDGRSTLVIELKTLWDKNVTLAKRALDVLQHYNGPHALMSYDPLLIKYVAVDNPSTTRGIVGERSASDTYKTLPLSHSLKLRQMSHLAETKPHFISYYFRDLPYKPVALFRAKGNPVITFTIRNPQQAAYAHRYCDQVTFQDYYE